MSAPRETDMDGMLHVEGDEECCSFLRCANCGGRLHMQGAYNGPMLTCEECPADQKDWKPAGTYVHDGHVIEGGS